MRNQYQNNKNTSASEKPKNRVYCIASGREKLLFETEKKAMKFIEFNKDEIEKETGYAPSRAYYCEVCGGWHVTHLPDGTKIEKRQQQALQEYHDFNEKLDEMKALQAKAREEMLPRLRAEYREHNAKILMEAKTLMETATSLYQQGDVASARKALHKAQSKTEEVKLCDGVPTKAITKIRGEIQLQLNSYRG